MRAYAGIGCHYMAQWMDRSTLGYTHMGGEGANWVGEAPFSNRNHVFQNLGDGTYNHSGYMAIRAAIAANTNITYKILFNDAVAMTGGQANDGGLTVPQVARQVAAEGAKRVIIVTDEPDKYPQDTAWPKGVTIHHRDDLIAVQKMLAEVPGVTILIYDQTCAAESAIRFPIPTSASLSMSWSARGAAIAASNRIACRCSRWRPNGAASAPSISRAATRIFPASKGFARRSSPCTAPN